MDDIVNSPAAANGRAYKYARLDQLPGSNAVSGLSALAQEGLLHEVDPKLFSRDLLMTRDS